MAQPRTDIRAERSRTPRLEWSLASQLYNSQALQAERVKAQEQLMAQLGTEGHTFILKPDDVQQKMAQNMKARASEYSMPTAEVQRRLEADPHLKTEYETLFSKLTNISGGQLNLHRFEILHIASENIAARAQARRQDVTQRAYDGQERQQRLVGRPRTEGRPLRQRPLDGMSANPQEAMHRPGKAPVQAQPQAAESSAFAESRGAQSRRTRPSQAFPPLSPQGSTEPAKASASPEIPNRVRVNVNTAPVRLQGSSGPTEAAVGAGVRRRVQFAPHAVREGIAEELDGTKKELTALPPEVARDPELSAISKKIIANQRQKKEGMIPPYKDERDEPEGVQASGPAYTRRNRGAKPSTPGNFGLSLEDNGAAGASQSRSGMSDRATVALMKTMTRTPTGR